ncbi:hypothetical protein F5X99DRAFT_430776 [Biscogniauxia marginata]|nr:hypothetical protein F5X99DRAFT_430776 [Biscogniauxia marginata]
MLPFISHEPKEGEPSCHWKNFEEPRLRRFPKSPATFNWKEHLGTGVDGIVLKAQTGAGNLVAVKIFFDNTQPEAPPGAYRYWAFERECRNCAILEMITTSLRQASVSGKRHYIHPCPTTKKHAIRNLKAFSTEGIGCPPPPHYKSFSPHIQINTCLGWMVINGHQVRSALKALGVVPYLKTDESYFAIVYSFVPKGDLDEDIIQSHLDFFYLAGFECVPLKEDNWRGSGILVDFSDLVSPHAPEWDRFKYGRMVKTKLGFYDLERPNRTKTN